MNDSVGERLPVRVDQLFPPVVLTCHCTEIGTVPVAIALFRGRYQVPWGQVLAAAVVATLPVALVVFAFQRRIVAGLTAGAVKG